MATAPAPPSALPAPAASLTLLAASQPDMVRASQKDDTYAEQFLEATREVARRLLGPFRALQYAREVKLLSSALYHGLTTGLGRPTLGEEYCGIDQVAAADGRAPSLPRRLLLAALLSAGPYAADRLAGKLDSAAEDAAMAEEMEAAAATAAAAAEAEARGGGAGAEVAGAAGDAGTGAEGRGHNMWSPPEPAGTQAPEGAGGECRSAAAAAEGAGLGPGSEQEQWQQEQQRRHQPRGRGGSSSWFQLLVTAAAARWARWWRTLVLAWPRARPLLVYLGRLHLALFYGAGAYYSLAHRLAGVRYSANMRPQGAGRSSYRVLGLLLGLQLGVTAAVQARAAVKRTMAAAAARRRQQQGLPESADGGGGVRQRYADEDEPAVFLDGYDDEEEPEDEHDLPPAPAAVGLEGGSEGLHGPGQEASVQGLAAARGSSSGRSTGSGSGGAAGGGGGGGGAGEGWERVEANEALPSEEAEEVAGAAGPLGGAAGGGGWEADLFGLNRPGGGAAAPRLPAAAAERTEPPHTGALPAPDAAAAVPPGATTAADGGAAAAAPALAAAAAAGPAGVVIPVLTSLRTCPLCLSPKSHPASTPCGHTFCWSCIATWCGEKPECPLCRSPLVLQQLVALYHTNC